MNRVIVFVVACGVLPLLACGQKLEPGTPYVDSAPTPAPATTTTATGADTGSTAAGGTASDTNTAQAANTTAPAATSAGVCGTNAATIGYAAFAGVSIKRSCAHPGGCHDTIKQPFMTDFATSKAGISGGGLARMQVDMPLGGYADPNDQCMIQAWAKGGYLP